MINQLRSTVCALLLLAMSAPAQGPTTTPQVGRIPVKIINGRLVVRCEASTRTKRLPFSLFVDFDRPCGLELHNKAAAGLRLDQLGGSCTLHFPGIDIFCPSRSLGDEDYLNDFTKLYSKELGEIACVGSIGGELLKQYEVTFDLASDIIELATAKEKAEENPEAPEGATAIPLSIVNEQVWFTLLNSKGERGAMNLSTLQYDTIVDERYCQSMGHPAGDIGTLKLQEFDFGKYVAFRPAPTALVHPDGAIGSLGINLLQHFRITIDRVSRMSFWTPTRPPEFPTSDLEFFKALLTDEIEPLEAWLEKDIDSRLAREGAATLMNLMIDELRPRPDCLRALEWLDKTRIPDLKTTEALKWMKDLSNMGRDDLAVEMGDLGIKSGRQDRYPEAVHKVHAYMGELLLELGQDDRAWEHLLSAAFGIPEDGRVSLKLGEFYERKDRLDRALSRYLQAVLRPESGPQAVLALESLQKKMPGLSVDQIDAMLQGRTYNFSPATRYEPPASGPDKNRCVLVEFFTNPHLGRFINGQWISFATGGTMGLEGLLAYYPQDKLAAITWHLPQPEFSAVMVEAGSEFAQRYGVGPNATIINGVARGPGAARDRDAEEVFNANKKAVDQALSDSSPLTIAMTATEKDGVLSGTIEVSGPAEAHDRIQVVLVERGVLCPGKGLVVVHRMLGRACLLNGTKGVPYRPENGKMSIPFEVRLEDITKANLEYLDKMEAQGEGMTPRISSKIDPSQITLVGYIRDSASNEVWQAKRLDVGKSKGVR